MLWATRRGNGTAMTRNIDTSRLVISLEIPLDRRQKWAREFPSGLATLGVHELDENIPARQIAADLANLVALWSDPGETVYAFPENPFFGSERKMRGFLETATEFGVEGEVVRATEHVFRCASREAVAHLLERCECETFTLFYATHREDAIETVIHACDPSLNYKTPERAFVDRVAVHGGCLSCAVDHGGVNAIGTRAFVVDRCLRRILGW